MIFNNPELQKNIKLELNATRFIIPALLLTLVAWVGWNSVTPNDWQKLPFVYYQGQSLHGWLSGFGFLFAIIWGTYLVANSLFSEIKQKTWDFVRMSFLSPAKILFGKLFGSASVVWIITLGGILPLIVFAGTALITEHGIIRPEWQTLLSLTLALIFWIILSHAATLLVGLYTNNKDSRHTAIGSAILIMALGFSIGGTITATYTKEYQVLEIYHNPQKPDEKPYLPTNAIVIDGQDAYMTQPELSHWYNINFMPLDMTTLVLAFLAFWAVVGAYRALRKELQYKDTPIIWIGFIICASLFLNGFTFADQKLNTILSWPLLVSITTLIPTCATEAGDIIRYRLWAEKISIKNFKSAFELMPLWMISFIFFLIFTLINMLISSNALFSAATSHGSILLLLARDLLAFHVIAWRKSIRRPLLGMIIYMAILYGFAPAIASMFNPHIGALYFYPLIPHDLGGETNKMIYLMLHIGIILPIALLFLQSWKSAFGKKPI